MKFRRKTMKRAVAPADIIYAHNYYGLVPYDHDVHNGSAIECDIKDFTPQSDWFRNLLRQTSSSPR